MEIGSRSPFETLYPTVGPTHRKRRSPRRRRSDRRRLLGRPSPLRRTLRSSCKMKPQLRV